MAITKTIEIDVNSQGAVGGINNVTNSIDQADKATQSLKSQLRQAQAEVAELSDKFGATSKEAINAAKKAAELKDAIGDAKALTDAFNPDAKFNALTGSLAGVASGFGAIEGSLVLAGVESENLQKTMVQLQSAMALSQGLQGLGESIDSFKQLGAVAKNALAGIRTGIAATGIGVLLVALGAVVAYWDDIKEAVGGVSSEQEKLNSQAKVNLQSEQKKLDAISAQENTLKAQGLSERDILKLKIQQTDQVIKKAEIDLQNAIDTKKTQVEAARRNQEILAGTLKFLSLPLTMILKTVDAVGKALGKDFGLEDKVFKGISSFVFDPVEVSKEADLAIEEQKKGLIKLKNDQDGFKNQIKAIDKDAKDKKNADNKDAIAKEKERLDAIKKLEEDNIKSIKDLKAKTESEKVALEKQRALDELNALKGTEEEKAKAKQAILDKYAILEAEAKAADKKKKDEDEEAYWITQSEKAVARDAETKARREKEIADEQAVADAKLAIQNAGIDNVSAGIGLLKGLFEKNKAIQKGLLIAENAAGIAKTIINTVAANAKAVAASPLTGGQPWVTLNSVSAGIGIASSIAATVKGLSALGGGGNAGSSSGVPSGGGGASAPAPSFNVVGNSGVNQIAQTLGSQQPVQAYVVANQVTTQQALDRNIVQNASIG